MATKTIHGDDLLHRFFQVLLNDQPEIAVDVLVRMYTTMGIWFPPVVYEKLPVLLPWVVRDPKCRGSKAKGLPDQWSSPDAKGYLRDDNSLVKSLPKSLTIHSLTMPHLNGARLGSEFVACHVWREVNHQDLASRHPLLNSFVPNLVWLPRQISKLTDREGSIMQQVLQSLSWTIFRHLPVVPELQGVADEAWELIPTPQPLKSAPKELNLFEAPDRFVNLRTSKIKEVIRGIEQINQGLVPKKIIASRYTDGLPTVSSKARNELLLALSRHVVSEPRS